MVYDDSHDDTSFCIFGLEGEITTTETFFEIAEEEEECSLDELGLCNEDQKDKKIDMSSIELLLVMALCNFLANKNKLKLIEYLKKIANYAKTFPEDELRSSLKISSPNISSFLIFTDVWDQPYWRDFFSGDQKVYDVPYLAFLLAMTDFKFTKSDLKEIASEKGTKVQDIIKKYNNKGRPRAKRAAKNISDHKQR